jgi:hypothetical protein
MRLFNFCNRNYDYIPHDNYSIAIVCTSGGFHIKPVYEIGGNNRISAKYSITNSVDRMTSITTSVDTV